MHLVFRNNYVQVPCNLFNPHMFAYTNIWSHVQKCIVRNILNKSWVGTQNTKSTNQQYLDYVKHGLPNKNMIKHCHPCWSNIFLSIDQIISSILIKYCQKSSELKAHDWCTPPADFRVSCSQFLTDLGFLWFLWFHIGSFECYQHQVWLQNFSRDWELCTYNYLFQIDYISKMRFRPISDHNGGKSTSNIKGCHAQGYWN